MYAPFPTFSAEPPSSAWKYSSKLNPPPGAGHTSHRFDFAGKVVHSGGLMRAPGASDGSGMTRMLLAASRERYTWAAARSRCSFSVAPYTRATLLDARSSRSVSSLSFPKRSVLTTLRSPSTSSFASRSSFSVRPLTLDAMNKQMSAASPTLAARTPSASEDPCARTTSPTLTGREPRRPTARLAPVKTRGPKPASACSKASRTSRVYSLPPLSGSLLSSVAPPALSTRTGARAGPRGVLRPAARARSWGPSAPAEARHRRLPPDVSVCLGSPEVCKHIGPGICREQTGRAMRGKVRAG
mmetsp:Transcript_27475/g.71298  ORF Transcript_27475/g.71298 Transcript_27475/m.71298 type:complete len:299 (+) Transcript_27475:852-1748(+)